MEQNPPLRLKEVLGEEYASLRPGEDFSAADEAELFAKVHRSPRPFAALSISGGGIRSATFALGVLQGFARHRVLERFDYLSTVSGGGYIGSWLSAWSARAGGLAKVIPKLTPDAPAPAAGEPDPIGHLRAYNNYLTPKLGFLSADTWTVAATVLRNIALNWLVLIPLILAALLVPRLVLSMLAFNDHYALGHGDIATAADIRDSVWVTHVVPGAAAVLLAYTVFNVARFLPSVGARPHTQTDFLRHCLAPLLGAVLLFLTYDALRFWGTLNQDSTQVPSYEVVSWALVPCVAGWLAFLVLCGKPIKERFSLLFGRLSVAVLLTGVFAGGGAWLFTNKVFPEMEWAPYVTVAPPLLLISVDCAMGLFVGFTSTTLRDEDREWFARALAWDLLAATLWILACALVLLVPSLVLELGATAHGEGFQGVVSSLLGVIAAISGWASTRPGAASGAGSGGLSKAMMSLAATAAPVVFVISVSVGLAIFTNWLLYRAGVVVPSAGPVGLSVPVSWVEHETLLLHTPLWIVAAAALAVFAFGHLMARYINVNRFSLQAMYRNRLIRAYLGASNARRYDGGASAQGPVSTFTGFLQSDNMSIHRLRGVAAPLHVVNVALNLVSGERLAWQQRKAQSFTISPLHCGNGELGYRSSEHYGGHDGISLGSAMAISGAAASPNMGYHSSPVIGFIMTMFNARLGGWLGNPGDAGRNTWRQPGPRSAVASLVKEALGLTDNRSPYVYLSDGGHFENLAMYEMVQRRCRFIVVLDGGCDPDFGYEDLGNALRKIRIDLRVPISFKEPLAAPLRSRSRRCALGRIHYSSVDGNVEDGWLLYIKPMHRGNEPPDVTAYWKENQAFPHQSTGDQWFDESQTESYRMLGLHTVEEMLEGYEGTTLDDLCTHVRDVYLGSAPLPAQTEEHGAHGGDAVKT